MGTVQDASGVPLITLQTWALPGGAIDTIACFDSMPFDGHWACLWDAGDILGLEQFRIRAQATDSFGATSAWTDWVTLTVDNAPPTITVDAALEDALVDGYLSAAEARVSGYVIDDWQASKAKHCVPGVSGWVCTLLSVQPGSTPTGTWSLEIPTEGADGIAYTLGLYGYDQVNNRSEFVTRSFRIDAVAPVLTLTTATSGTIVLPDVHHLRGLISDGGEVSAVRAIIQGTAGDIFTGTIKLSATTWTFDMPIGMPDGIYSVWIEAVDKAGNGRIIGPFRLKVSGRHYVHLPLVLRNYDGLVGPSVYLPIILREFPVRMLRDR